MINFVLKQKEQLENINDRLKSLVEFFIGATEEVKNDCVKENCAMDTIKLNSAKIEEIEYNLNKLEEIIRGGN